MNNKKKVIIVGAGVAGLTSGIYCLDNDFDVEIYEKHSIPGGECTGWTRYGTYIDGCAHWIVGTNPRSDVYPLWEHIGAFDNVKIFPTEYLTKFQLEDGRIFTFWADLKKLKKEMLFFFPEDKIMILAFIRLVRCYQHVRIPARKPLDMMNLFEMMAFGIPMLPMAVHFMDFKHISVKRYISWFKNPELGRIINRFMEDNYNIHSFFYICQSMSQNDAGMVEGGSLALIRRVTDKYTSMGGKLFLSSPVKKIVIENDKATGIELEDGRIIHGDYVIASGDIYHTLNHLLEGKYKDKGFASQFKDHKANPINTSVMLAYKTKANMDFYPKMMDFNIKPFDMFGKTTDHFCIRNYAFDKSLPSATNETLLTVLIPANEAVYEKLKKMDKESYHSAKKELGMKFKDLICEKVGIRKDEISLIDVVTPLTYERYCNAFKGSYMSFITTERTKGLMRPGIIKGLNNFVIAGQWIMPPGGLPVALLSGKHACQRICKMEKKKFICKEKNRFLIQEEENKISLAY